MSDRVPNEDDLEELLLHAYDFSGDPFQVSKIQLLIHAAWEKGWEAGFDAAL
jgi:hypothetical protein